MSDNTPHAALAYEELATAAARAILLRHFVLSENWQAVEGIIDLIIVAAIAGANRKSGAEIERLEELIRHCWVHSGYQDCGSAEMDSEMLALYQAVVAEGDE